MSYSIAQAKELCNHVSRQLGLKPYMFYYDNKRQKKYAYSDHSFNIPALVKNYTKVQDIKFNLWKTTAEDAAGYAGLNGKLVFVLCKKSESFLLECTFYQPRITIKAETVTINNRNYKVESSGQMALNLN